MPAISPLHISILVIAAAFSALLHSSSRPAIAQQPLTCITRDLPNPIASLFPNNATGVLNATLVVIPVPHSTARRLIPLQYGILEHAYRSLMPDFPEGMYPVLLQAAHDHDVQLKALGITIDDFSRIGLEFPFIDLLNDNHTSFRWAPAQLITSTHRIALQGSAAYGTVVSPATFRPACDAYDALPNGATFFGARSIDNGDAYAELEVSAIPDSVTGPYTIEMFRNITNQPTFANGSTCDQMIRLFGTSMSRGAYEPVLVKGRVRVKGLAPLDGEKEVWDGVYGVQVATPFVENNYLDCSGLRGYDGAELEKRGVGDGLDTIDGL
ncbi:hypothetical protein GE09DRAFT_955372 [Coniochaeta sp. 2T2.1]|nr:hypothetical protein GE09DRAFT_955372 [Coniochaeta sp. 2T2.1]